MSTKSAVGIGDDARGRADSQRVDAVIMALCENLPIDDLLERVVTIAASATDSDAAFVYTWHDEDQRLVLRAATEGRQKQYLGDIRLRVGQGITGWAAETRQPAVINQDSPTDPRVLIYPELQEERFASVFACPIIVDPDEVVGVFALYSTRQAHFDEERVAAGQRIAGLLASAIDRAELRRKEQALSKLVDELVQIGRLLSNRQDLRQRITQVCALTVESVCADLCCVTVPGRDWVFSAVGLGATPERVAAAQRLVGRMTASSSVSSLENTLRRWSRSFMEDPKSPMAGESDGTWLLLGGGDEALGVLGCVGREPFSASKRQFLAAVADRIGTAVRLEDMIEDAERANPVWRLHDLLGAGNFDDRVESLASTLGADLDEPHVVLDARCYCAGGSMGGDSDEASIAGVGALRALERALIWNQPGSCVYRSEGWLRGLVRLDADLDASALCVELGEIQTKIQRQWNVELSVGIGSMARARSDYRAAYRTAHEALEIGESLFGRGRVTFFGALGHVVYLHRMIQEADLSQDGIMASLERLAEYDRRKRSRLVETLDCYMACQGNVGTAAQKLFVHRNTLRQRLRRIEQITGLHPDTIEDWFPVQLACRLLGLRTALSVDGDGSTSQRLALMDLS